jgi:deoxyribodipyrimidine photo-lyase
MTTFASTKTMLFSTRYADIQAQIAAIDPVQYGKTRNFTDRAVTRLSPYISRGVISTRQVMEALFEGPCSEQGMTKLLQELAWRDYFQQVWRARGERINEDMRQPQPGVLHREMPDAVLEAKTGITGIYQGIAQLYKTGYMHNHVRMYTAMLACNLAHAHWRTPANWMYFHLLDADWASNACSWQWVASAFSGKRYFADQENINRHTGTRDRGTYLDTSYDALADLPVPEVLRPHGTLHLETPLPAPTALHLQEGLPTYIYNFYNLDPSWDPQVAANRVLLLEPSVFARYPVSGKTIDFVLGLADNIPGIQVWVGEWTELMAQHQPSSVHYKEHPLNAHYVHPKAVVTPRDWMFPTLTGLYPSFFAYWKKAEPLLQKRFLQR